MNRPQLLQPPPPTGTLGAFASATVDLLGAEGETTLQDHLRALGELSGTELVLLYHGSVGAGGFDLVASFGVPAGAAATLHRGPTDEASGAGALPGVGDAAFGAALTALGVRARWDEPLWADGDCIGRLVFGSRRWDVLHPGTVALLAAANAQIAVVLRTRLTEQGDAEAAAAAPDLPAASNPAEPLLFRRRRDRFIALLAHELRNPVAPIQSGLDLLATDRLDPAARRDTVRMMQRQVAQLAHLINDFLDTARLNTGRLRVQRKAVPLLPALRTALESVEPAARDKGQHIERLDSAAEATVVHADPVRLTQAFANLLAAGVAATPLGGTLTVGARVEGDRVALDFEDEGPPVEAVESARLFDVFAALAPNDAEHGAGLGLVRGLLALNDGTVVARNRDESYGRVFTVTLPVVPAERRTGSAGPASSSMPSRRILVVDDNLDAGESLGLLFQLDGHRVRLAHDGPGAVAAAGEFDPDVIVMDLGLPGFSGHEAIMRIRNTPSPVRPAIVALTGWGSRADRDASARAGADLHLVKPVAQAELDAAIQALLPVPRPTAPPR